MQREFTGRHMLFAMIGFFSVIIVVNAVMATLANLSWTGLVVKNSYVASQGFNARIAATEARDARGLSASLTMVDGVPHFVLARRDGTPEQVSDVVARFARPTHEGEDLEMALPRKGDVHLGTALSAAGLWSVEVQATLPDGVRESWLFRVQVKR